MSNPYQPGQFCWVDLNAKNKEEAESFYGSVFGWTCEQQDTGGGPPYGIFKLDGEQVAGIGQMSVEMIDQGIPSLWNHYVQVDDCQAVCDKATQLGGNVAVPTMPVMDAGTLAFLQDPAGATFALWQPKDHFGSEVRDVPNAPVWHELATRDFQGSQDFYGKLFGWQFEDHPASPAEYKVIKLDGKRNGGIMEMTEDWGDMPPHWTIYFQSADTDQTAEVIKKHGGQICHGPFDAPEVGRIAICSDPHSGAFNLIQFFS